MWQNTEARRRVDCPRCMAKAGEPCREPRGRVCRRGPHIERLQLLQRKFPGIFEEFKKP